MAQYFGGHELKKGKFLTPFNQVDGLQLSDWSYSRMPEYLWLGLILGNFERTVALEHCGKILTKLHNLSTTIDLPKFSQILALNKDSQKSFFDYVISLIGDKPLAPLNLLFTTTSHPVFASLFSKNILNHDKLASRLKNAMEQFYGHQTDTATDIRFLIVYFLIVSGRLNFLEGMESTVDAIRRYPYTPHSDEDMRRMRPIVRSMEGAIQGTDHEDNTDSSFVEDFWKAINGMYECELTYIDFTSAKPDAEGFIKLAGSQLQFYSDILSATRVNDDKMLVLVGIAAYAFKRIRELVNHDLFHTISGRSIARCVIECYIMVKYLCKEEVGKPTIWSDYQDYGLGQYKLIYTRIDEDKADMSNSHVNVDLIKLLVSHRRDDKFIDMDTSYFGKKGIREKSQAVSEKGLWSHYYDYDSAFEHGLWGAIRESVMLDCASIAHRYHFIPDTEDRIKLKSVWSDCKMVMTKLLVFLGEIYGYPAGFPSYGGNE